MPPPWPVTTHTEQHLAAYHCIAQLPQLPAAAFKLMTPLIWHQLSVPPTAALNVPHIPPFKPPCRRRGRTQTT